MDYSRSIIATLFGLFKMAVWGYLSILAICVVGVLALTNAVFGVILVVLVVAAVLGVIVLSVQNVSQNTRDHDRKMLQEQVRINKFRAEQGLTPSTVVPVEPTSDTFNRIPLRSDTHK